jgi:uncharacterized protein YecE (DUF72 family)
MNINIGTSGYHYSWWNKKYYKQSKKLLEQYSKDFNTVEINNTFYKIPTKETVLNWKSQVPRNFKFSIKMNQYVTHYAKLNSVGQYLRNFFKVLNPIKNQITCILFQFNKNLHFTEKIYMNFQKLYIIEKKLKQQNYISGKTKFVFEFRNKSFYNLEMHNLFKKYRWIFAIWHGPKEINLMNNNSLNLNYFSKFVKTSNMLYIRLHGTKGLYYGSYYGYYLKQIHDFIKKYNFNKVYIYFNNVDNNLDAIHDGTRLKKILK